MGKESLKRHEWPLATTNRCNNMRQLCRSYNPKPFYKMTDQEVRLFSIRQAAAAANTIDMNTDEADRYASAIYDSIIRYNASDKLHHQHMNYLRECEAARQQAQQQRLEAELRYKKAFRIYIN